MKFKNRLLQNKWANFNQTKHKASLGKGYISLINEGPYIFPRGDNYKIAKIWKSSSIEPLGQFQQNLAKIILGWRGFRIVQMERPHLFTSGDNRSGYSVHSRKNLLLTFNFTPVPHKLMRDIILSPSLLKYIAHVVNTSGHTSNSIEYLFPFLTK